MLSGTSREAAAEFLGTFVLIVFGSAVVAQVVLSGGSHGGYLSINLAWGLAVMMGVYVSAGVSGAHLNPAVTLALAVHRQFPWRKVLAYCAAQMAGAFTASAAGIFATYPQEFLSNVPGGLVDQVVGTALLILVIFAIGDRRNSAPDAAVAPVLVGLLVVLIGMTFGFNAGYAINPARDLGPRLFTVVAGWGSEVFRAGHHWWWVPIVGPCLGAVLGGAVYDLLITHHHPREERAKEVA
ncbi:MAG: aquaporin [Acidobacteria bacterium]|nr:MAG: aquaporin [Acidobacteriota bacterium]